jgi:hypothetical protein
MSAGVPDCLGHQGQEGAKVLIPEVQLRTSLPMRQSVNGVPTVGSGLRNKKHISTRNWLLGSAATGFKCARATQ